MRKTLFACSLLAVLAAAPVVSIAADPATAAPASAVPGPGPQELMKKLNLVPLVQYAKQFDPNSLQFKDNLIF